MHNCWKGLFNFWAWAYISPAGGSVEIVYWSLNINLCITVGKGCSTFEHDYIYIYLSGRRVSQLSTEPSFDWMKLSDTVELTLLDRATLSLFNFNPTNYQSIANVRYNTFWQCTNYLGRRQETKQQIKGNFIANFHRYTSDNGPTTDYARFYTNSGRTSETADAFWETPKT